MRQIVEQRLCRFEIGGREPFGKPVVDRPQQRRRIGGTALLAPQPGNARGGAQSGLSREEQPMSDYYDIRETRDPATREADLFARLPEVLRKAMSARASARPVTIPSRADNA